MHAKGNRQEEMGITSTNLSVILRCPNGTIWDLIALAAILQRQASLARCLAQQTATSLAAHNTTYVFTITIARPPHPGFKYYVQPNAEGVLVRCSDVLL